MDEIQQRKATLIKQLKRSDSPVRSNFTIPDSYRKWVWGCKKIIRFWARIQRDRIYSPALVETFGILSGMWISIGTEYYANTTNPEDKAARGLNNAELLKSLKDIRDFKISSIYPNQGVELHEIRIRSKSSCSLCGCELVWPAYITTVSESGKKTRISKQFGVKCLHSHLVRLNQFIETLESTYKRTTRPVRQETWSEELVTA